MSTNKLFSRDRGTKFSAGQGLQVAEVDANTGVATLGSPATTVSAANLLAQFPELQELGRIVLTDDTMAGNSSENWTVPSGKYWRLLALVHVLVTDANVANRAVVVEMRNSADTAYETITHANVAASTTAQRTTLFGTPTDGDVSLSSSRGVAAAGTITIAEPVTDGDSFTVGDITYTLLNTDNNTGNVILIGGSEAATKTNIATALQTHPDVTAPAAFTGDDLVVTAREESLASDSIVFVEVTLTHVSNVLDGSGTLGGTTAGVDPGDKVSALSYPTAGILLGPGEDVNVTVTNGVAGDTLTTFLVALEFDNNPVG